ncbi:MAG TPA: aldo/keto reductase [Balneolaceae bacterium]|nr:aldo/keto reductase [Balneolaceae bacterium]
MIFSTNSRNNILTAPGITSGGSALIKKSSDEPGLRLNQPLGLGGVPAGNGFHKSSDEQIAKTFEAAWATGIRYFDTAPSYGNGLAERRLGRFLFNKKRDNYILSTKIGRLMYSNPDYIPGQDGQEGLFKGQLNFDWNFDYSAQATRRSIEDSLQRMGLTRFDIVFIHDISPEQQMDDWTDYFGQAREGAIPELERMREEGIIKGWGMGVNKIAPALKSFEAGNPDILLSATQYSLMNHRDALEQLFPSCKENNVSAVIGAPLNAGFLADKERFNYGGTITEEMQEKKDNMQKIANNHDVDLRSAALQFSYAPSAVTSVVVGASQPKQMIENVISMNTHIPNDFWKELKEEQLIAQSAPEPKND